MALQPVPDPASPSPAQEVAGTPPQDPGGCPCQTAQATSPPNPDIPLDGAIPSPLVGDPIDLGSGNMYQAVTDYTTVGQNPLAFIRYYNSMATPDTLATALGRNWRSNYDRYLRIISGTEVDAERPDRAGRELPAGQRRLDARH